MLLFGRGGSLEVSAPAFCSEGPSSNHAGYHVSLLLNEKTEINDKEAGMAR